MRESPKVSINKILRFLAPFCLLIGLASYCAYICVLYVEYDDIMGHIITQKQIISTKDELSNKLRMLLSQQSLTYNGDPSLVGARLQAKIRNAIENNGGRIISSLITNDTSDDFRKKVIIRIDYFVPLPKLLDLLQAHNINERVYIDKISIISSDHEGDEINPSVNLHIIVDYYILLEIIE